MTGSHKAVAKASFGHLLVAPIRWMFKLTPRLRNQMRPRWSVERRQPLLSIMLYVLKVLISALAIVGITELSKRSGTFWGGVLASLPLTSLLAFVWLYSDTGDVTQIAGLSWAIFWLVLPSLTLFVSLPVLLHRGFSFPIALCIAIVAMVAAYIVTALIVRRFGIQI